MFDLGLGIQTVDVSRFLQFLIMFGSKETVVNKSKTPEILTFSLPFSPRLLVAHYSQRLHEDLFIFVVIQ